MMIVKRSCWWSTSALVLLLALLSGGCAVATAIDHRKCLWSGFVEGTKDYEYCREKLQQIRDEDYERQRRFIEMMIE